MEVMEKRPNIYLPEVARIVEARDETPDTKTFVFRFRDDRFHDAFTWRPGQFVELSVFGLGEAPFGFASSPTRKDSFDITIRAVGALTRALHAMGPGDEVGIRGPLGNHFPFDEVQGRSILFIGGGIGLPPLRSLIHNMLDERDKFGEITILYGARTPTDLVYKEELKEWEQRSDIKFMVTVDRSEPGWDGTVGMVPTLFPKADIKPDSTTAYICGPPVMIRFVIQDLVSMGFAEENIISTLERHMKCGVGKCNHCCIGHKYVCRDGPVFSYKQMKGLLE
jgi:sulfhydrogenase subunit gamma (sulfur reductase)